MYIWYGGGGTFVYSCGVRMDTHKQPALQHLYVIHNDSKFERLAADVVFFRCCRYSLCAQGAPWASVFYREGKV